MLPLLFLLAQPPAVGPTADGFKLPNGWTLTPAGRHLVTTDLPLNVLPLSDTRALVATSGFNSHDLTLCDISGPEPKPLAKQTARNSWYGLAADAGRVWWSGGGQGGLHTFTLAGDALTRTSKPEPGLVGAELAKLREQEPDGAKGFRSGLAYAPATKTVYSLDINGGTLTAIPAAGKPLTVTLGGRPYDVLPARDGKTLFVTDWAGKKVWLLDPATLAVRHTVAVGEHPNQMVQHADGRLFVACATSNSVSVIDPAKPAVVETISTALFPKAPAGSTPDAVALAPDGKTLFVANADNNCVAVIDVEAPKKSQVKGFVPTGWYPTAVAVTPDGKRLLVGVGKGLQSRPNPTFTKEQLAANEPDEVKAIARRILPYPYIGTTLSGALSVVDIPDEARLKEYTDRVYKNCPYSDAQLTAAPHPTKTAIPTTVGDPSPIKYVIYVIKENRTYDQVFGDFADPKAFPNPKGNGDPSLCLFPRKVTPNHHKLADEFVLLDNLYCNGQVSRDGHPWSTMAYHTDYVARDWHLTYSRRKGVDDDDDGSLQKAPNGYLWDACRRAGLTYRSYGEYGTRVSDGKGGTKMEGRVPGLVGMMCPDFGLRAPGGGRPRDTDNVTIFLKEYDGFVRAGAMPRFTVMSLGEDHTDGTTPGRFTPQACVASNDLALGRLVEHVSKGPLWHQTAIFVIEDDAQNGPDHVDAHRTVGLVISPYTKRKFVDSTHYATVSMIRTMELILGLPPLSQYDAAARPMFESFTDKLDPTPYTHTPAEIDLNAVNGKDAYGAARSARMDFTEYDKIDDFELNEVLWGAIMGPDAPQPPAVRRAIPFRAVRK
jgi:YVTN family beta-propeller protein